MVRSYHVLLTAGPSRSKTSAAVTHPTPRLPAVLALASLAAACQSAPPEPQPEPNRPRPRTESAAENGANTATKVAGTASDEARPPPPPPPKRKVSAKPVASVQPSPDDPLKGKWTIADATKGLPAGKQIVATLETDMGSLECKMFDDKAPITVANFIGLARGIRPWKTPEGKWEKKPAYEGTIFHRIIKAFMIQGGDSRKNGTGDAGYEIPDEVWEDGSHDRAGLLCMANKGANTNSAQFFITDAAYPSLDGGYTIFGECGPVDLIHKLASLETGPDDRPKTPPVIKKVTVTRK